MGNEKYIVFNKNVMDGLMELQDNSVVMSVYILFRYDKEGQQTSRISQKKKQYKTTIGNYEGVYFRENVVSSYV